MTKYTSMYMLPRNWSNRDGHESCGTEKDSDKYIYRERKRARENKMEEERGKWTFRHWQHRISAPIARSRSGLSEWVCGGLC